MKNNLLNILVLTCLFSGLSLHAQNTLNGYWSGTRFSEGYLEIENDAPNNFVLIISDKNSTYTMVECEIDFAQKMKKGQDFPITFFGVCNEEIGSFNNSFNFVLDGDSISHLNIGFVRLLRNGIKPVFEIHFYGNYGNVEHVSADRKRFRRRKFNTLNMGSKIRDTFLDGNDF